MQVSQGISVAQPKRRKGFWALADQGAVSLGNFATQIVLARSLSRSDYGVFALLFGILLVFFISHAGLITYPLSLKGAKVGDIELRGLTFASFILTLLLVVPLAPVVFGTTVVLGAASLTWIVIFAMLLWQIQETFRRALMAHLRHGDALYGDALSYLGQAAVLWMLAHKGLMTLERVFLVLALTSAAAALLQCAQLGLALMPPRKIMVLAQEYWSVGRWALFTGANEAASRQAFPWALAVLYGPTEAAYFQGVMNLVGVSHPVIFSTNNLIVPAAAHAHKKAGVRSAWHTSAGYSLIGVALLVPYFLLLMIWPHAFLSLLYGKGSPYTGFGPGLRLAVLAYSFVYGSVVVEAFLYSLGRSRLVFTASLGGTVVALVPSAFCIGYYGVDGAMGGLLIMAAGRLVVSAILAKRTLGRERTPRATTKYDAVPLPAERNEMVGELFHEE